MRGRPPRAGARTHVTAANLTPRELKILQAVGARSCCPTIRMPVDEYAYVKRAAQLNHMSFSTYCRLVLGNTAAEDHEAIQGGKPPPSMFITGAKR
jgi:hypothetical protein